MKTMTRGLVVLILLCTTSFGAAGVPGASPRVMQHLRAESVLVPASAPETDNFLLVAYFEIAFDNGLAVTVALYNDPATPREVDYAEIYQDTGHLLGIAWLDEFGIQRAALDYSLIGNGSQIPAGILILLPGGDPT